MSTINCETCNREVPVADAVCGPRGTDGEPLVCYCRKCYAEEYAEQAQHYAGLAVARCNACHGLRLRDDMTEHPDDEQILLCEDCQPDEGYAAQLRDDRAEQLEREHGNVPEGMELPK